MSDAQSYVEAADGIRWETALITERERHRIVRLLGEDRVAKITKGTGRDSLDGAAIYKARRYRVRSRIEWRFLRRHPHAGLLRVFQRVKDERADEGYVSELLEPVAVDDNARPFVGTLGEFLHSAYTLCAAVGVLHDSGNVHGDITPANVCARMEERGRTPVLIDFEMSVKAGQYLSIEPSRLSKTISGTPACCSPEQVRGDQVFARSDVFCLGLTLMSWLSGKFGVMGAQKKQSILQSMQMCMEARYPHWDAVEEALRETQTINLLRRAVSLDKFDRFFDGNEMAAAIKDISLGFAQSELARPLITHNLTITRESVPAIHTENHTARETQPVLC